MTTFNSATTVALRSVVLNHVRIGDAYKPSYASQADAPQWSVQVIAKAGTDAWDALLDLAESGLPVQRDGEDLTLNLKQYIRNMQGVAKEVVVVNRDYQRMSLEQRRTVGNGSIGHVEFYVRPYANANGVGMTSTLTGVVVTEQVEYTPLSKEERLRNVFGD